MSAASIDLRRDGSVAGPARPHPIAAGTIEEKMENLKARKQALVAGILNAESGATLRMTEADVEALFDA
jgi:SNF2 family DNA or RNA helicase